MPILPRHAGTPACGSRPATDTLAVIFPFPGSDTSVTGTSIESCGAVSGSIDTCSSPARGLRRDTERVISPWSIDPNSNWSRNFLVEKCDFLARVPAETGMTNQSMSFPSMSMALTVTERLSISRAR